MPGIVVLPSLKLCNKVAVFPLYKAMKRIVYSLFMAALLAVAATGCIEDGYTSAPADAPVASLDTLRMGTVFTEEGTPTHRFTLRNRSSKSVNITDIVLDGDNSEYFRMNVDGFSGTEFHDVEIRAKDSIYVFIAVSYTHLDAADEL